MAVEDIKYRQLSFLSLLAYEQMSNDSKESNLSIGNRWGVVDEIWKLYSRLEILLDGENGFLQQGSRSNWLL